MAETKQLKPGYRTSEFWITAVALPILGAFVASGLLGPDHLAMRIAGLALSVLSALGYTASRGKTKAAAEIAAGNVAAAALMRAVDPPEA